MSILEDKPNLPNIPENFDSVSNIVVEKHESIKLNKMSKGYNWEIKLVDKDDIKSQLDRLIEIDKQLRDKYGEPAKTIPD
jgi:hypothetical protein